MQVMFHHKLPFQHETMLKSILLSELVHPVYPVPAPQAATAPRVMTLPSPASGQPATRLTSLVSAPATNPRPGAVLVWWTLSWSRSTWLLVTTCSSGGMTARPLLRSGPTVLTSPCSDYSGGDNVRDEIFQLHCSLAWSKLSLLEFYLCLL